MIRSLLVSMCLALAAGSPLHAGGKGGGFTEAQTSPPPNLSAQGSSPAAGEPAPNESPEQVRRRELIEKHGAEVADAILAGVVLKDMTMEQVLLARGAPERKEVVPPDAELWHFPAGEVAFSGGKVTYVELRSKVELAPEHSRNARSNEYRPEPPRRDPVVEQPVPLPPAGETARAAPAGSYLLQVGSFKRAADAERLKAELALLGISTRVESVTISTGEVYHRVRSGPYQGKQALEEARKTLKRHGKDPMAIKVQ